MIEIEFIRIEKRNTLVFSESNKSIRGAKFYQ
ncbi:MAG: ribosomal protein L30/L7E [Glaciecola sp.]|jgi:ribosomal protein L30/L7E